MDRIETYLALSAFLVSAGIYGILCRRNLIAMLIAVELVLNGANINMLALGRFLISDPNVSQIVVLFSIALAGAEISIGLSLVFALFRTQKNTDARSASTLKG